MNYIPVRTQVDSKSAEDDLSAFEQALSSWSQKHLQPNRPESVSPVCKTPVFAHEAYPKDFSTAAFRTEDESIDSERFASRGQSVQKMLRKLEQAQASSDAALAEIEQRISALRRDEDAVRQQMRQQAIQTAQCLIQTYSIKTSELGIISHVGPDHIDLVMTRNASASNTRPPKHVYRSSTGEVWAGRGRYPKWLREALQTGQTLESFAEPEGCT